MHNTVHCHRFVVCAVLTHCTRWALYCARSARGHAPGRPPKKLCRVCLGLPSPQTLSRCMELHHDTGPGRLCRDMGPGRLCRDRKISVTTEDLEKSVATEKHWEVCRDREFFVATILFRRACPCSLSRHRAKRDSIASGKPLLRPWSPVPSQTLSRHKDFYRDIRSCVYVMLAPCSVARAS